MPASPRQNAPVFTEIFGEFAGSQWVDVGIDPYGPDKDIGGILLNELIDGLTEAIQGLLVVLLDGVDDAVLDMVLQNDLSDIIDGRAHGGDLDQNLRTVASILHHLLDRLQMADGAGKAV